MQDEKPRWRPKSVSPQKSAAAPPPPPKPPPVPETPYAAARRMLDVFLDTAGDLHLQEFVDVVRKIPKQDLVMFHMSIPIGYGRTAVKCQRAREAVSAIMAEQR